MIQSKQDLYLSLVDLRKKCDICNGETGLHNPSKVDDRFDSIQIGPWSIWQGNLDAKVMIIGQDWGDINYFIHNKGRDLDNNPTNKNLQKLLYSLGLQIPPPSNSDSTPDIAFFTNAILCLKDGKGGLQAKVQDKWFENCAVHFLKPTIDLIHPEIVITLGTSAYQSIRIIYNLPKKSRFREAVDEKAGFQLDGDIRYFPMYHCGQRVINTWRRYDEQYQDWQKIIPFLKSSK